MKDIKDITQLKLQLSKTGKELSRGQCIWADHFAVQCISDFLKVSFLIFNEQQEIGRTTIKPSTEELRGFIILYLTRRNHYNLIGFKQSKSIVQYFFSQEQLPSCINLAFSSVDGFYLHTPVCPVSSSKKKSESQSKKTISSSKKNQKKSKSIGTKKKNNINNNNNIQEEIIKEEEEEESNLNSIRPQYKSYSNWDLLPDSLIERFFMKYFTEDERKYCLANVCDHWGTIIWGKITLPSLFVKCKKNGHPDIEPTYSIPNPLEYISSISKRVPHIKSLIYSIEMDHFQRGWMNNIITLPFLTEFHFKYGCARKYHLPNPDLKILIRERGKTLNVINISPSSDNATVHKFSNCGFNSISKATQLSKINMCIYSDTKNTFLKVLPVSHIENIVLYDCAFVTKKVLASFLAKLDSKSKVKHITVELYNSAISEEDIILLQENYNNSKISLKIMSQTFAFSSVLGKRISK